MSEHARPPSTVRFHLRPHHVLRGLAALWIAVALVCPGFGCWAVAGAYLGAAWYTRKHQTDWPADVEMYLAERGWAPPRHLPEPFDRHPPIPFRPMTIPELYSGALTIMLRNWPSMLGVPAAVLTGFAAALAAGMYVVVRGMGSPQIADLIVGGDGDLRPGAVALILVVLAAICAVALPGDGLLISLGVQVTDMAVRGERIRFDEALRRAAKHKLAICRLAVTYYLIGVFALAIQVAAFFSGFYIALIPTVLACGVASVVVGLLLSMSPVVLLLENRGLADSFRRSIELCKPAVGRLFVINLVWIAGATPLVALSMLSWVVVVFALPAVFGLARCLPVLIYADLRMRRGDYGQELRTDWTRNMC